MIISVPERAIQLGGGIAFLFGIVGFGLGIGCWAQHGFYFQWVVTFAAFGLASLIGFKSLIPVGEPVLLKNNMILLLLIFVFCASMSIVLGLTAMLATPSSLVIATTAWMALMSLDFLAMLSLCFHVYASMRNTGATLAIPIANSGAEKDNYSRML